MKAMEMFDVFLCHASEDKDSIVMPIYDELCKLHIHAFVDTKYIEWGDSLTEKSMVHLQDQNLLLRCYQVTPLKKWPLKRVA